METHVESWSLEVVFLNAIAQVSFSRLSSPERMVSRRYCRPDDATAPNHSYPFQIDDPSNILKLGLANRSFRRNGLVGRTSLLGRNDVLE